MSDPKFGLDNLVTGRKKYEKLIIQIPCFNEEKTLPNVLRTLPRELPGIKKIEWLVIDDGSHDRTVEVAHEFSVDHVIRYKRNRGLAKTFQSAVDASLKLGADIIVNLDGDNQYQAADIPAVIAPILAEKADVVIGARPIWEISHFSWLKKFFQTFGSAVVSFFAGSKVHDVTSGFRAYSRHAALRLNSFTHYSHTLETLVHSRHNDLLVVSVPIHVNPPLRISRLSRNMFGYILNSSLTLGRLFLLYYAAFLFWGMSFGLVVLAVIFAMHSRIHGAKVALELAGLFFAFGILSDHMYVNRRLLELIQLIIRDRR